MAARNCSSELPRTASCVAVAVIGFAEPIAKHKRPPGHGPERVAGHPTMIVLLGLPLQEGCSGRESEHQLALVREESLEQKVSRLLALGL